MSITQVAQLAAFDFSNIDTVVLDFDGTIADSTYVHAIAWTKSFQKILGISITPEQIIQFGDGMAYRKRVDTLMGLRNADGSAMFNFPVPFDENKRKELTDAKDVFFQESLAEVDRDKFVVPGIEQFLYALVRGNKKIYIASNGQKSNIMASLEKTGLAHLVSGVITGEDVGGAAFQKPHPAMLFKISHDSATPLNRMAYMGDTDTDSLTAKNAGDVRFFGITDALYGSGSKTKPQKVTEVTAAMYSHGAVAVVNNFEHFNRLFTACPHLLMKALPVYKAG